MFNKKFRPILTLTLLTFLGFSGISQVPDNIMTESGTILREAPLDDITSMSIKQTRKLLPYEPLRESDVFWKKRVWRVIDVREKMNQPFSYPARPLFQILIDAIQNEEKPMRVFSDEDFKQEMSLEQIDKQLFKMDTVIIPDPVTYENKVEIVKNDIDFADVKRYRVKEIWYFDKQTSTQKVRILGIAPLITVKADGGSSIGETPIFWVYYPEAREYLVRENVFNPANDASQISWEDLMEMRYFSSYIIKVSNVGDQRLQNQFGSGRDMLLESEKLKQAIFNYENDLWVH
ncbi:MAG: gliding motility protein GldN [Bacteroidetes bacterium]|nr:gliding motility protein GldN [Bacteroidota bacterium]